MTWVAAADPNEFRSDALAQALEKQDMAAVALALRNGSTIVPLIKPGTRDNPLDGGEVWTYRDQTTGDVAHLRAVASQWLAFACEVSAAPVL